MDFLQFLNNWLWLCFETHFLTGFKLLKMFSLCLCVYCFYKPLVRKVHEHYGDGFYRAGAGFSQHYLRLRLFLHNSATNSLGSGYKREWTRKQRTGDIQEMWRFLHFALASHPKPSHLIAFCLNTGEIKTKKKKTKTKQEKTYKKLNHY